MPVTRMNHAVLYVRNAEASATFYARALDFQVVMQAPGAVFMQAPASNNDHDLGLFSVGEAAGPSIAGRATVGLYHLAWEVDTLDELSRIATVLGDLGALAGASDHVTTKALYAKDVDGIEFEVSWLVPADRLEELAHERTDIRPRPLDLAKEIEHYGGSTRGGAGVSFPAKV